MLTSLFDIFYDYYFTDLCNSIHAKNVKAVCMYFKGYLVLAS